MKAIVRRLHRLEERYQPAIESPEMRSLRARLGAARLRCGLPPISPESRAELKGMSIVAILHSGRMRISKERALQPDLPALSKD